MSKPLELFGERERKCSGGEASSIHNLTNDLRSWGGVQTKSARTAGGTANAHMLEYLGLSDSEKAVIFSVIKESRVDDALYTLERKFETIKNGKGVALTLPLTSMIGKGVYAFLSGVSNAV